eukprot:1043311-Amphidinium_carterae.1
MMLILLKRSSDYYFTVNTVNDVISAHAHARGSPSVFSSLGCEHASSLDKLSLIDPSQLIQGGLGHDLQLLQPCIFNLFRWLGCPCACTPNSVHNTPKLSEHARNYKSPTLWVSILSLGTLLFDAIVVLQESQVPTSNMGDHPEVKYGTDFAAMKAAFDSGRQRRYKNIDSRSTPHSALKDWSKFLPKLPFAPIV